MAKRSTSETHAHPAELSSQKIKVAIPKLQRRLEELRQAQANKFADGVIDRLDGLWRKLDGTLVEIFGAETLDYQRHQISPFSTSMPLVLGEGNSDQYTHKYYMKAVKSAIAKIETVIEVLREQLDDSGGSPAGKALQAIEGLDLHPEIEQAAGQLYRNGHYANAVEDACKALNLLVKLRSKRDDLDGVDLMQKVFSPNSPILAFNTGQNQTEASEQRGMMFLYSGVMAAFRNRRAHDFVEDDPEGAIEVIAFVSFLAKQLEKTKKV